MMAEATPMAAPTTMAIVNLWVSSWAAAAGCNQHRDYQHDSDRLQRDENYHGQEDQEKVVQHLRRESHHCCTQGIECRKDHLLVQDDEQHYDNHSQSRRDDDVTSRNSENLSE